MITTQAEKLEALRDIRDKIDIIYDGIFVSDAMCMDFVDCCESCGKHSAVILSCLIQCRDKLQEMADLCDDVNELVSGAVKLIQEE
jgi:hypothetical protein